MSEELAEKLRALESLPDNPPRSRLEPYRTVIFRWRRRGWSYRKIALTLTEQANVRISEKNLRKFVKLRLRERKRSNPELEPALEEQASRQQPELELAVSGVISVEHGVDKWAAARERMRNLKAQAPPDRPKKLFEFTEEDSIRPLELEKSKKER